MSDQVKGFIAGIIAVFALCGIFKLIEMIW